MFLTLAKPTPGFEKLDAGGCFALTNANMALMASRVIGSLRLGVERVDHA